MKPYIAYFLFMFFIFLNAQPTKDNAKFIDVSVQKTFADKIFHQIEKIIVSPRKEFIVDMRVKKLPNKINLYHYEWHTPSISQGLTGTCWCFSSISFFESEIYRLTRQEIKLSEMYIVYWEYIEKSTEFIKSHGKTYLREGSEANEVLKILKKYGIVPISEYSGRQNNQQFNHKRLFEELSNYLNNLKKLNEWNEEKSLSEIKIILNKHLGSPPQSFTYEGETHTPISFLDNVTNLNIEDYICIISYKQEPFYSNVEYKVPDNWRNSSDYYNVPLNEYFDDLKFCIKNGFTVAIGGDVSESGFDKFSQCAIIPSYDIASEDIDDNARQLRFYNGSTTDDHGLHLIGYLENFENSGKSWFLVKDSGNGSRYGEEHSPEFGYFFLNEDYIKLKIMYFMVNKNAINNINLSR